MGRYVEGQDRTQSVLFPELLDDWIHEDSTVRVIDVFVDELDLSARVSTASFQLKQVGPPTILPTF